MSTAKIQSGDSVKITAGNYRGTTGRITKVVHITLPNGQLRVRASVDNVAKIVKYRKSQSVQGQKYPGSMGSVNRMIDISNISLVDDKGAVSKVKIAIDDKKKKTRVLKTTGATVAKQRTVKETKVNPDSTELVTK